MTQKPGKRVLALGIATFVGACALVQTSPPCATAQGSPRFEGEYEIPPPPPYIPPPPPPPPVFIPPPPPPPPVFVPPPPPPPVTPPPTFHFTPPVFVPIPQARDLTSGAKATNYVPLQPPGVPPTQGLMNISSAQYEKQKNASGPSDWIIFKPDTQTQYHKISPYAAKLALGQILVCVRRPSHVALLDTPAGEISIGSDGDAIVKWDGDVVRIFNLSGRGAVCKVKLNEVVFGSDSQQIVAIAPGFELVAGGRKITRGDIRPTDGIARRASKLLANGRIAISEFSVESVLSNSALIASLQQAESNPKDLRIAHDLSKMAAVLNCINGQWGYTTEGQTGIATKPGAGSK